MKKIYVACLAALLAVAGTQYSCNLPGAQNKESKVETEENEENEAYDGAMERNLLEIEKLKDPALGYVPSDRLYAAMENAKAMRMSPEANSLGLIWTERGPIYDSIGSSNGNGRGGPGGTTFPNTYTSGRIRAVFADPSDATGNTVFVGGVGGGLWKTTNFTSSPASWVNVNDFFDNLSITSICQDPSNTNIMYFSTGEPTQNADAIIGKGIWKSTDHGTTWSLLPASASITKIFKIICDPSGRLYVAVRGAGIRRSSDGGASFTDISPTGYGATSCTDLELTASGTLIASIGYYTSAGAATIRYTTSPATVDATSWSTPTGLPSGTTDRLEIATTGTTVYLLATDGSNNIYALFGSSDDGLTYAQQNLANYTQFTSTQGWYDLSLDVNPSNPSEVIMGQLDAYRSLNGGRTISQVTYWVSSAPYVHADHHFVKMMTVGAESRIIMASDGGLFYSNNGGTTFTDKNRNLGLKQFYSCAIHPSQTNYFLAGAQDNGVHRLTNPGLSYSYEITGGDGAYVDIDQNEPQFQFGSYVYNQYKVSKNGGASWTNIYFSNSIGLFINPYDYDDVNNKLYASYGTNLLRWNNPTVATSVATSSRDVLTIPGASGNVSALYATPNTNDRLFVGTSAGKLFRIDNASAVSSADIAANTTDLSVTPFPGFINCVITGDDDQHLLVICTNYGINNVWYSADGGNTWTGIDGNLPDMPVRWGVFAPGYSDKLIIATEAGVYVARSVAGAATVWLPSPEFPMVRTDMLKVRPSDKLILAATHGRGLWSAFTPTVIPVKDIVLQATANNGIGNLSWTQVGATNATKFTIQYSINGISFTNIATVNSAVTKFSHQLSSPVGYYRIVAEEPNYHEVYSNTVVVRTGKVSGAVQLRISPNPVTSSANFVLSSSNGGSYHWFVTDMQGRTIQTGKGNLTQSGSINLPVNVNSLSKGSYHIQLVQNDGSKVTSGFVKQ